MNQIITSKVIVGSTRNSLNFAKIYGTLCLEELLLYEIIAKLINNCKLTKEANKEEELLTILNHIQNKVDYICNIKDRHSDDYREVATNDYNIIQNSNTAPTVSNNAITIELGDGDYTFKYSDFTKDFADANGDSPDTVRINSLPDSGVLQYNSVDVQINDTFDVSAANKLVLVLDNNTTTITSFLFQISDDNINKLYSDMATMSVTINDVENQPPSYVGENQLTIAYNNTYTFVLDDFIGNEDPGGSLMFIDPEGDNLEFIKVTSLPVLGVLKLNNISILTNATISNADIVAGNFIYEADLGETDAYIETFDFSSSDDGSHQFTVGGVYTLNALAYINLPPDSVGDGALVVDEGDITTFTRAMFTTDTIPPYSDPENNIAHRLRLDTIPAAGTIKLDGVGQIAGDIVYFSDIDLGKLTYTQAVNAGGTIPSFTFSIADEGSNTFTS